jgi:(p)ppGpp synthase/HD superfamily hydrolase
MTPLLKRALDQAAVWHHEQTRKYPGVNVPYMSHLAGVAVVLARHGFDDEVVSAGALHDTIEDADVSAEDLAKLFGQRVADLVIAVTEADKSQPWEDRKRSYLEQFSRNPWEAQAITLADKIDNFQSIAVCAASYGDPWAMFKRGRSTQLARFEELRTRLRGLPRHSLIDDYEAALDELTRV